MSSWYLLVALWATFGVVVLASMRIGLSVSARRKTLKLLQSEVGNVPANLRERELSESFTRRALIPLLTQFGGLAKKLTPDETRKRLEHKLALAGSPPGWDADKLASLKLFGGIGMLLLGGMTVARADLGGLKSIGLMGVFVFLGFFGVDGILAGRGSERQHKIRRAMPDTMDLLTISVEAGLGFDSALAQVRTHVPGPLSEEIGRMMHQMRLGISRADAMRSLADRTDVDELKSFVLAMIQAETYGVSISKVLRAQAKEQRTKRRQLAEEKAMKIPVKILFPLIFCVLPALFVVIIGPGAIRIVENLFGITP